MSEPTLTPEVTWAQRSSSSDAEKNRVYLTLVVPDVAESKAKLDIQPTKVTFTGHSETKKCTFHVELELYAEIDPAETKKHHSARALELVLRKKELTDEYWPRLLKDSKKQHFLKTDFDKVRQGAPRRIGLATNEYLQWVDEDEQETAADDDDYMSKMAGMGGDGGFGGIDFSKLGGGAGGDMDLSALGGGEGEDEDEDLDDEDDEDLPALESETAGKGKGKIEEVE